MLQIGLLNRLQKFVRELIPPAVREDLDFDHAVKTVAFDHCADSSQVDATLPHQPAIVEQIGGGGHPVAYMVSEQTVGIQHSLGL